MAQRVADILRCSACLAVFKDPVMLPCSHNFCRACLQNWWEVKGARSCPLCRMEFRSIDVPLNLALRDMCEAFSQASVEPEPTCSLHKEKLRLSDQHELVCHICKDAESHASHKPCPLEVPQFPKEKRQDVLHDAKTRLEDYKKTRQLCNSLADYIRVQRKQVESKIKKDFEELHRFLQVEEEARLAAVRDEELKKSQMMKEEIEALGRGMNALLDVIRTMEEQLMSTPVSLSEKLPLPAKPELPRGALLDEAKHVGNLKFNVWERMKETVSYSPVILDPNTAQGGLNLSEDLTSVSSGKGPYRPKNPERLTCNVALGSALVSGTYTWDVEVGDNTYWRVGVLWLDPYLPDSKIAWSIVFRDNKYSTFNTPTGSLNPLVKLQRIRVHVDTQERSVLFSDCHTNVELAKKYPCDWPRLTGSMKLYPYLSTKDERPLRIIPLKLQVATQCHLLAGVFTRIMACPVEDHLQCPSCLDIFQDPVILPCSHSFCRECVRQWWEMKGDRSCPVCRAEFKSLDPPMNLALRNVCEAFSRTSVESEEICSLHQEKLKLFCWDHKAPVCLICRDSEIHTGHKFCPIDEVVKGHQENLRKTLKYVRRRLQYSKQKRDKCIEQAEYIKVQWEQVERKIKEDFEDLRCFLQAEEEARLAVLREEEQKKRRRMKEEVAALSRHMAALSDMIRSTEELLTSGPVSSMKNFQTAMAKIQKLPDKLEPLPQRALLDEAKHVGNLKFSVWERMKEVVFYSPIILDPNTAGSKLCLSEDLTSVSFQGRLQRPRNAERLKGNILLGSALDSATHKWDVEVGDNTNWKVGVAWGDPCLPNSMLQSSIGFCNGEYRICAEPLGSWNPAMKLQRIRVHVDINERSVLFSESHTDTILCKRNPSDWPLASDSMNVNVYPYFYTKDTIPLQIIPLPPRVTTSSP
ncbi:uncharacterized protein LOC144005298 [Festucalex cinctus]